jgi:acyl-CoA synthetase (AMP-forming)/AMP-acid ligase II
MGFLEGGELFVTGRRKDMIILRGRNLYAEDVEQAAAGAHPALRPGAAAAFAVPAAGEERVALAHELRPGAEASDVEEVAAAVRRAVGARLGLSLEAVVLVEAGSLPRTSSGKIRRHAAREMLLAALAG